MLGRPAIWLLINYRDPALRVKLDRPYTGCSDVGGSMFPLPYKAGLFVAPVSEWPLHSMSIKDNIIARTRPNRFQLAILFARAQSASSSAEQSDMRAWNHCLR